MFRLGLFPCTVDGFSAVAARDADVHRGDASVTAPDTRFASQKTGADYTLEVSIPWREMPGGAAPASGQALRLNLTVFDGDVEDAATGANIRESSLGWSAFDLSGKQFLPYLWPQVTLE